MEEDGEDWVLRLQGIAGIEMDVMGPDLYKNTLSHPDSLLGGSGFPHLPPESRDPGNGVLAR